MKKVFIDTSVFVRFLTKDDPKKFETCQAFFEKIQEGKLRPYTSNIVFLELYFVLKRLYKFPSTKVSQALEKILTLRNLTVVETTDTPQALEWAKKWGIKYADCLIATQVAAGAILVTYDQDFTKITTLNSKEPQGL